ncbi:MAG: trypsin-like peptidase domain-containing protein [Phycisphaeraceae bacterium]|nr:trypsin-like peptidase domain-containing protein [Phycisphaeraceae bacterium]
MFEALIVAVALGAVTEDAKDVVTLKSGAVVQGQILKRTDRRVWVDIGPDVVVLELEDVGDIVTAAPAQAAEVAAEDLFFVAVNSPTMSPKEHAKIIGPSVIKVRTPSGLGSGVIINREGHAITNAHVVQGETKLQATVWFPEADGSLTRRDIDDVELIAVNNEMDLALVQLPVVPGRTYVPAPLEREERLEIGQPVFAIGNPLGLERTLTQGVISTPRRSMGGRTYIQTDTPINPGNSGGPLFNTRGEVIGITNMKLMFGENMGFAIPSRYVKDFLRNREAFAYDKRNPNSGYKYHEPPSRTRAGVPPMLRDGSGS